MNFKDLTECPFCGYDEYYQRAYTYGTIHLHSKYDGKFDTITNSDMYEGLQTRNESGRIYCGSCNKYLGNIFTNKLGKAAEKALKQSKE